MPPLPRRAACALLWCSLAACGSRADDVDAPTPITFPTPWEAAEPSERPISGSFLAVLDGAQPGAGWFESRQLMAQDAAFAAVREVPDATWPVVQVLVVGREVGEDGAGEGHNVLEIDVALNHWVAGEVPFDGEAAVGVLTTAEGDVRYVTGGVLEVVQAGVEPGQVVQATFTDAVLTEVVE